MATRPELPTEMRAAVVDHFGPPDVIHTTTVRVPKLGRKEVLIRVEAAAVGEWDPPLVEGSFKDTERTLPTIFGADGSGTVEATGPDVKRFAPGDKVYGYGWANKKGGFFAEYVAVNEKNVMKVPAGLSLEEAAALGVSGLTALQGLDQLELEAGQSLLLVGASGGVGHAALQLAKHLRLRVFAIASGADGVKLCRELGADAVVEGHRGRVDHEAQEFAPQGFDGALIFAGSDGWRLLLSHVKKGGRVAWPNGVEPEPEAPAGVRAKSYDGVPSPENLERLNRVIGEGPFRVVVAKKYPLERAAQALKDVQRHHVGVIELRLD